jgi:thiol-disulfide isomerase/thioredoxin
MLRRVSARPGRRGFGEGRPGSGVVRAVQGVLAASLVLSALVGCGSDDWTDKCVTTPAGIIECAPGQRPEPPEVAGELLSGGTYDLADDRGRVVVVNFWGSWCGPCRAEAPDLEATYQATRDAGVRFLGINIQDPRDKALAFEEGRVTYPSIFDPGSRLALAFDIPPNSIPATIVLDREGRIAVVIRRAVLRKDLEPIVARIAAEQSAPDDGAR